MDARDNPVRKIPLGVTGVDAKLIVVELMQDKSAVGNGDVRVCGGMEWQEIQLLQSQVVHLCREMKMRSKSGRHHAINQQHNQKVIKLLHRITATTGRRQVTQQDEGVPQMLHQCQVQHQYKLREQSWR